MALSLPFGAASAPPSVRLPVFEGSFGSLDARSLRETMIRLVVHLGALPGVNRVELLLPAGQGRPDVAPGDPVSIELGYDDSGTTKVFTGTVHGVQISLGGVARVTATDGGATLAGLRLERSYESMSAGDIVQDLLGEAGVSAGSVESGPKLPFHAVGAGRSALAWIEALARSQGFLAWLDGDGGLHFGPPSSGAAVAAFTYGQDLLGLSIEAATPAFGAATVVGEGAAGSEGGDAWAWLLKDPAAVTGSNGSGVPARTWSDGAARTKEAADAAARARVEGAARSASLGDLSVPGTPEAMPGTAVEVSGTPGGSADGRYLVLGASHRLDRRGLTSSLRVSGPTGAGSPGGGLL